jgi:hypothetical protein
MRMAYEARSTTVDWVSAGLWIVLALGLLGLLIVINSKLVHPLSPPL